jgi:Ca2+-binding EF-hand superfamily protein
VDDVLIQFPIVDVWMCMDFLPLPAQSSDNTNNTIQNMSQFAAESDDTRIAALFAEFDVDGGGSIDASEFQQLAYACGEVLSDEETAAVVKALDADNNGTIDLNEFKTWLNGFDGSNESDPLKKV